MSTLLAFFSALVRSAFTSQRDLALENAALRQQLAACLRGKKCPRLKPSERALWALLSKFWSNWKSPLVIVRPKTVIGWLWWRLRLSATRIHHACISRRPSILVMQPAEHGKGDDVAATRGRVR